MTSLVDSVSEVMLHIAGGITLHLFMTPLGMQMPKLVFPYRMLIVSKTLFDCLQRRFQHHRGATTQMNGTWEEVELCEINQISVWFPSLSSLG